MSTYVLINLRFSVNCCTLWFSCTPDQVMTPDQFSEALKSLNWKQSDFCRMAGVDKGTPSRWVNGATPIPEWANRFLEMAQRIRDLAELTIPPKK